MMTFPIAFATLLLLAVWLIFFSRLSRRGRRVAVVAVVATIGLTAATTRIRGVTGDLVPVLEWRWTSRDAPALKLEPLPVPPAQTQTAAAPPPTSVAPEPGAPSLPAAVAPASVESSAPDRVAGDYPQFLGETRNGAVAGVRIADDWSARPPKEVWRRPIGAGWSGFAVAGGLAVTQEQRGGREMVVAYRLADGSPKR